MDSDRSWTSNRIPHLGTTSAVKQRILLPFGKHTGLNYVHNFRSLGKISQLVLFGKRIEIYCDNHTKHINALSDEMQFLNLF
jgi:hypothetical protein